MLLHVQQKLVEQTGTTSREEVDDDGGQVRSRFDSIRIDGRCVLDCFDPVHVSVLFRVSVLLRRLLSCMKEGEMWNNTKKKCERDQQYMSVLCLSLSVQKTTKKGVEN